MDIDSDTKEYVILTPKTKSASHTVLWIERVNNVTNGDKNNIHVAGGEHNGIVINKIATNGTVDGYEEPVHVCLEFCVYLVNSQTSIQSQECRILRFWFKTSVPIDQRPTLAQCFFRDLVSPRDFPRDYVGFIKKIMKLMQNHYPTIKKIEIELRQLKEPNQWEHRPMTPETSGEKEELPTEKKVLNIIESSYPNPIYPLHVANEHKWDLKDLVKLLKNLEDKGLIKLLELGSYTRITADDTNIQVVKQMPALSVSKQPTIAIITAQYCEKVAVDALIDNKETFVRYTTVGESNVYTLGNIGSHMVVCTKLPTTGHTREAVIAAGNTTTRLLGTFQKVDHVFLVGIGGGIPHYTDYSKHVRLGDVVASSGAEGKRYIYTYCENAYTNEKDYTYNFECKEYSPHDSLLQDIVGKLKNEYDNGSDRSWLDYLDNGIARLQVETEQNFRKPPRESDKLFMTVGEGALIEVSHPSSPNCKSDGNTPRLHLGPVASGRAIIKNEQMRQAFATYSSALAFDTEFDPVIESIEGSCRDSYILIRGIADYRDGNRHTEWQQYSSVAAAALAKALILKLPSL